MSSHLTIFKTGDTVEEVIEIFGDYDAMFRAALAPLGLDITVIEAHRDAPLPDPARTEMALITGSPNSVTDRAPWAEHLAAWTRAAQDAGTPLLGVCYGHQLLAYAHGGEVSTSGAGMEIGTTEVELSEAGRQDPLLGALDPEATRLSFQQVHGDEVSVLPPGAVHLASNPVCRNQAFRLGDRTWAVQFHPEFPGSIMPTYVEARADRVRALAAKAGLDPEAELSKARASVAETPLGPKLLARFVELAAEVRSTS